MSASMEGRAAAPGAPARRGASGLSPGSAAGWAVAGFGLGLAVTASGWPATSASLALAAAGGLAAGGLALARRARLAAVERFAADFADGRLELRLDTAARDALTPLAERLNAVARPAAGRVRARRGPARRPRR